LPAAELVQVWAPPSSTDTFWLAVAEPTVATPEPVFVMPPVPSVRMRFAPPPCSVTAADDT